MTRIDPSNAGLYTELNELQNLKSKSNRNDPEALKKVAKDFEQIFLSMMLKSMRQANEVLSKDNFLNSSQVKFFEEMRDEQLSLEMAQNGNGIGLAEVLVKQLSGTLKRVPDSVEDATGGDGKLSMDRLKMPISGQHDPTRVLQDFISSAESQREYGPGEISAGAEPPLPERFETPEQFVSALKPLADKAAEALGVEPQVILAQAALETGWGKHITRDASGNNSYNLFNIKADRRWGGDSVAHQTTEFRNGVAQSERARFRQYGSYEQSFNDYVEFIKQSPRYQQALAQADDSRRYLDSLQSAGYATDPQYADKIYEISQRPLMLATIDTQVR